MLTIEYFLPMKKKEVFVFVFVYVFANMERFLVEKNKVQNKILV